MEAEGALECALRREGQTTRMPLQVARGGWQVRLSRHPTRCFDRHFEENARYFDELRAVHYFHVAVPLAGSAVTVQRSAAGPTQLAVPAQR